MNVRWHNTSKHLMNEAGDGGSGGSPGGTSLLTTPANGGGTAPNSGNAGASSGANNSGNNGQAGNTGNNSGASGSGATDWKSVLPEELQKDATFKKFSDVPSLANAYLNAQKLIGRDKIPVPSENTTPEQWNEIYEKLGLPKELEKYDIKFEESISLGEDFTKEFKQMAHKAGILPKQAQVLADWFSQANKQADQDIVQQQEQRYTDTVNTLKKEWGNAFDQKVQKANHVLKEIGGEEVMTHLNNLGLGADATTMKFLAKVADALYGEHKVVGENNGTSAKTPAEVTSEIKKIMSDREHPYFLKNHPGHKDAVQLMQNLHKELAGGT